MLGCIRSHPGLHVATGCKLDTPGQIQYRNTHMYRAVKLRKNRSENLSCQRETTCSTHQGGDDYAPETS